MPLPLDQDPFSGEEFQFGKSGSEIFASLSGPSNSETSPLGMELGEFILEEDLEFMNRLFNLGASTGNMPGVATGNAQGGVPGTATGTASGLDPKLSASSSNVNGE